MKYFKLIFIIILITFIVSCGKKEQEYMDDPGHKPGSEKQSTNDSTQNGNTNKDSIKQTDKKIFHEDKVNYDLLSEKTISPQAAGEYVGKIVSVVGFVAEVHKTDAVEYINFVNKFPNNPIAGVIFKRNFDAFGDISSYEGKNIQATGRITTYKDKLEIILDSPSQIKPVK